VLPWRPYRSVKATLEAMYHSNRGQIVDPRAASQAFLGNFEGFLGRTPF
jgi:hypothetical protein